VEWRKGDDGRTEIEQEKKKNNDDKDKAIPQSLLYIRYGVDDKAALLKNIGMNLYIFRKRTLNVSNGG
jgi:hypothetical protein